MLGYKVIGVHIHINARLVFRGCLPASFSLVGSSRILWLLLFNWRRNIRIRSGINLMTTWLSNHRRLLLLQLCRFARVTQTGVIEGELVFVDVVVDFGWSGVHRWELRRVLVLARPLHTAFLLLVLLWSWSRYSLIFRTTYLVFAAATDILLLAHTHFAIPIDNLPAEQLLLLVL